MPLPPTFVDAAGTAWSTRSILCLDPSSHIKPLGSRISKKKLPRIFSDSYCYTESGIYRSIVMTTSFPMIFRPESPWYTWVFGTFLFLVLPDSKRGPVLSQNAIGSVLAYSSQFPSRFYACWGVPQSPVWYLFWGKHLPISTSRKGRKMKTYWSSVTSFP